VQIAIRAGQSRSLRHAYFESVGIRLGLGARQLGNLLIDSIEISREVG
jgi:hypothetical protein